ncbi:MAG: transposase, family [Micromonosporaceae bacterium]|nr:transposase, family [Micromonosporaceae bacterium]
MDETYVKVKGRWTYLYRAVDSRGQTIGFLLSAKRDAEAAKRFFRKALAQPQTVNPRTITVDKNAAYPKAAAEMKRDGELWRRSRLRQVKCLNNIVEQDHRNVKRLTRVGLWLWQLLDCPTNTGRYEAMAMIIGGQALDDPKKGCSASSCATWADTPSPCDPLAWKWPQSWRGSAVIQGST